MAWSIHLFCVLSLLYKLHNLLHSDTNAPREEDYIMPSHQHSWTSASRPMPPVSACQHTVSKSPLIPGLDFASAFLFILAVRHSGSNKNFPRVERHTTHCMSTLKAMVWDTPCQSAQSILLVLERNTPLTSIQLVLVERHTPCTLLLVLSLLYYVKKISKLNFCQLNRTKSINVIMPLLAVLQFIYFMRKSK